MEIETIELQLQCHLLALWNSWLMPTASYTPATSRGSVVSWYNRTVQAQSDDKQLTPSIAFYRYMERLSIQWMVHVSDACFVLITPIKSFAIFYWRQRFMFFIRPSPTFHFFWSPACLIIKLHGHWWVPIHRPSVEIPRNCPVWSAWCAPITTHRRFAVGYQWNSIRSLMKR